MRERVPKVNVLRMGLSHHQWENSDLQAPSATLLPMKCIPKVLEILVTPSSLTKLLLQMGYGQNCVFPSDFG